MAGFYYPYEWRVYSCFTVLFDTADQGFCLWGPEQAFEGMQFLCFRNWIKKYYRREEKEREEFGPLVTCQI